MLLKYITIGFIWETLRLEEFKYFLWKYAVSKSSNYKLIVLSITPCLTSRKQGVPGSQVSVSVEYTTSLYAES